MTIHLNEMQTSALLEAGNIGSGHSAIALSQLMGKKIMVAIPSIEIVSFDEIEGIIKTGNNIIQIGMAVLGDLRGMIFFTLSEDRAMTLCDVVMGQKKGATKKMGEVEISAIKEVGSIIGASYLNALSEMTRMSMLVSVPEFAVGKIELMKNILNNKEVEMKQSDIVLCIRTEFIEADTQIEGFLIFAPEDNSAEKLIKALGV